MELIPFKSLRFNFVGGHNPAEILLPINLAINLAKEKEYLKIHKPMLLFVFRLLVEEFQLECDKLQSIFFHFSTIK